ncbi:MAG: hypothetical protein ABS873_03350 [Alkalibacterium sp.]
MKNLFHSKKSLVLSPILLLVLTGCSSFAGLRTPLYDGNPVETNDEAIKQYAETQRINEENEANYFRYPLSETLSEPSLEFSDAERVTLEKGTYTVGEDLPSGRVMFEGHPSNFSPDVFIIKAGNVTVYDTEGVITFENHFQEGNGVMRAVVDLRDGQTIEVEGDTPEVDVNYSEETAENALLPDPEIFIEDELDLESDPESEAESVEDQSSSVTLMAGHYEVGKHLEAGTYTLENVSAPRTAVLYHFTESDTDVVELTQNRGVRPMLTREELDEWLQFGRITEEEYEQNMELFENQPDKAVIELSEGDKLYLPMINSLELVEQ